jgi:hypothetical protein
MNRTLVPATKPTTVTVIVDPELRDELTRATQLTGTLNISAISSAVRRRSLTAPISLLRFEREPTDLRDRGLHRPGCGVHRCLHASRIRRSVPQRWRCKRGGSYHRLSAPWGRRVSVGWSNRIWIRIGVLVATSVVGYFAFAFVELVAFWFPHCAN